MNRKGKVYIKKSFASRSHFQLFGPLHAHGKMSINSVNVHFQGQLGEQRSTKCSSKYQGISL